MVAFTIRIVGLFAVASVACAFTAGPLAPALRRSAVVAGGSSDYLPHWRSQASVAMPRAAVVKAVAPRPGPAETGASVMSFITALGTRNAVTATAAFVLAVIGASILRKRGEVRRLKRAEEKKGEKTVEKKAPPPKKVEKKVESKAGSWGRGGDKVRDGRKHDFGLRSSHLRRCSRCDGLGGDGDRRGGCQGACCADGGSRGCRHAERAGGEGGSAREGAREGVREGVRDGRHACIHSDTEIRGPEEEFRLQGGPRGRWLLQSRLHMGMMLESEGISAAACSSQ